MWRYKATAARLLVALNDAGRQPAMNLGSARVYLKHSNPMISEYPLGAPGGVMPADFSDLISSTSAPVGSELSFTKLLGDLEFWQAHPEQDFGWILRSEDEGTRGFGRTWSTVSPPGRPAG